MKKHSLAEDIFSLFSTSLPTLSWRNSGDCIEKSASIISLYSSDDAYELLLKGDLIVNRVSAMDAQDWIKRTLRSGLIKALLNHCSDRTSDLIEQTDIEELAMMIIRLGKYSDIKVIDKLALTSTGSLQVECANLCSVEALRAIKGVGPKSLRKVVYSRLGPVECLDDMIDDKYADIRMMGYQAAPFGYAKLGEKTGEIALGPTCILIKKIPAEYLPMLLANRNLKSNAWVSKEMEKRMNSGC